MRVFPLLPAQGGIRLRFAIVILSLLAACGLCRAQTLFRDTFAAADGTAANDALSSRQQNGQARYNMVPVFAASADRSQWQDSARIEGNALALSDKRMGGKGPAAVALERVFTESEAPFAISLTIAPGSSAWAGFKWTPASQRNGNWPDLSHGISFIITPGGQWTIWNNEKQMKQVLATGSVIPASEYRVTLGFSGKAGERKLSVSIDGILALAPTPCLYPWQDYRLILQALGRGEGSTAKFSDLRIEKLGKDNDPAKTAADMSDAVGIWVEGEDAVQTNFHSGKVINAHRSGPSGGMFLRLYVNPANQNLPQPPYYARYKMDVPESGVYNLWIAATPQNASWASPISWSVDGGAVTSLKDKRWTGASYGEPRMSYNGWVFGWILAGSVDLSAGEHEIELRVEQPRTGGGNNYIACVDALLLTSDRTFVPSGNHTKFSTQPSWDERMKTTTPRDYVDSLNRSMYYELIGNSREQVSQEVSDFVTERIRQRPLPADSDRAPEITEFGLHGMERPFVAVRRNADSEEIARAYDLLARTGVDSFRTADATWHRLAGDGNANASTTELELDYADLDFQIEKAQQYGITHLFTMGYPPARLTVGGHHLSAAKPELYPLYEKYFDTVLNRYRGKGVRYAELGNEVDAPEVWWKGSTVEQYVREMQIMWESVQRTAPEIKTVAFGSTYARDEHLGGEKGGRRFITAAMDLGIDKYSDTYALHHMRELKVKDYPAFFRRELERAGTPGKPLLNTEQGGGPYPHDTAKTFARIFFLYDMPRMDFFMARDFYENGYLKPVGLFDFDWRPKLRMLAYAFSVDAMRGRKLVGMARPAEGVEAYVLEYDESYTGAAEDAPRYSIVLWNNEAELLGIDGKDVRTIEVDGFRGVRSASDWQLGEVQPVDAQSTVFAVADEPIAIYADQLPEWALLSRDAFLDDVDSGETAAPLPTSH